MSLWVRHWRVIVGLSLLEQVLALVNVRPALIRLWIASSMKSVTYLSTQHMLPSSARVVVVRRLLV